MPAVVVVVVGAIVWVPVTVEVVAKVDAIVLVAAVNNYYYYYSPPPPLVVFVVGVSKSFDSPSKAPSNEKSPEGSSNNEKSP